MKIAIISDAHLGDPMSTLFYMERDSQGNKHVRQGDRYQKFVEAAGTGNNYLILVGDIIDFAIESYEDAYKVAKAFFLEVKSREIAKKIIYIPGNHDFDIWHTVEHQVQVIEPLGKGENENASGFLWSVAGRIDDRQKQKSRVFTTYLSEATPASPNPTYTGLFLDKITEPEPLFEFCYPNLYLITDEGETIIITHGHYLEAPWPLLGEWAVRIFEKDDWDLAKPLFLKNMASINFMVCQLMSSGVGQSGELTKLIKGIQREAKDHDLKNIKRYLSNLITGVRKHKYISLSKKLVLLPFLYIGKKLIINSLMKFSDARYSDELFNKPEVQERFWNYYEATRGEINLLNKNFGLDIPNPYKMIFGHTHRPLPSENEKTPELPGRPESDNKPVVLYNTGGWLNRINTKKQIEFCGARVYKYETGKGITSVPIK